MVLPTPSTNLTYLSPGGEGGDTIVNNVMNHLDVTFCFFTVRNRNLSTPPAGPGDVTGQMNVDSAANTIEQVDGGSWVTGGFTVGMVIQFDDSGSNNNGFYTITAISGTGDDTLTVEEPLFEDETSSSSTTVSVSQLEPGRAHIISSSPTGVWTGHEDDIAFYFGGWIFIEPREGYYVHLEDEDTRVNWDGTAWVGGDIITDLSQTIGSPPDQAEVQAISDKVDELLGILRASRIVT